MGYHIFLVVVAMLYAGGFVFVSACVAFVLDMFKVLEVRQEIRKLLRNTLLASVIASGTSIFALLLDGESKRFFKIDETLTVAEVQRDAAVVELEEVAAAPPTPNTDTAIDLKRKAVIFIHTLEGTDLEPAKKIAIKLQNMNAIVPGIQTLDFSTKNDQIRYFHLESEETADKLAKELGIQSIFVTGYQHQVRPTHFEIWLAGRT